MKLDTDPLETHPEATFLIESAGGDLDAGAPEEPVAPHAAAGLSVALSLALALSGVAGTAVLLVGLLVGVSRCYLGVHYPGDVLVGWALAALGVGAGLAAGLLV